VEDVEDRACAQVLIGIERRQVVDGRNVPSLKQTDAGGLASKVGGFHAGGSIRDGGEGDWPWLGEVGVVRARPLKTH
jgi:hypothetical protein